jgi:hypothetical protein
LVLIAVDSFGVRQVLRFDRIQVRGEQPVSGTVRAVAPVQLSFTATRDADSLGLDVHVLDALGTEMATSGFRRVFLQMRGRFRVAGTLLGKAVADSGMGFFETYVPSLRR